MRILQRLWTLRSLSKYVVELESIPANFNLLHGSSNELINEIQNLVKIQRNTLVVASTKCRTGEEIAMRDGGIQLANTIITSLEKFKQKPYNDPKTWARVDIQNKQD